MKKEHVLAIVAALFVLAYVLDAVVNPLSVNLATPYQYFNAKMLFEYAFTTTSIAMKSIAIVLLVVITLSALGIKPLTRGITLLILSALLQLYAVQDIATSSYVVPIEWSLSFTLAGLLFLPLSILFVIAGLFSGMLNNIAGHYEPEEMPSHSDSLQKLKSDK